MKQIISFVAFTFIAVAAFAKGPMPAPAAATSTASAKVVNAGAVRFQFTNINDHADSVLVIFDRFDHTGAGVIYKVFAADQQNCINIDEVPAGKYFVTIQCMGLHHDHFEKTITVKKSKNEKVSIGLEASELFSKNNVVIPATTVKMTDLSILSSK